MNMSELKKYRVACTLTYGDIYGQVIIWLIVIFLGLASSLAMMQSPVYGILTGGLLLVISLPFLLFAFVTTLLNHIELSPVEASAPKDLGQATPQQSSPQSAVQPS
jgi:hypothetical protein